MLVTLLCVWFSAGLVPALLPVVRGAKTVEAAKSPSRCKNLWIRAPAQASVVSWQ